MEAPKVDLWMPLYVGDLLQDTAELSPEEFGVYLRLLSHMWTRGGRLPLDHVRLARLVGCERTEWDRVWMVIARFFGLEDGHIVQARLIEELERAQARRIAASQAGRRSGEVRRGRTENERPLNGGSNDGSTVVATDAPTDVPTDRERIANTSPSPSPPSGSSPSPSPPPSPSGQTQRSVGLKPDESPPPVAQAGLPDPKPDRISSEAIAQVFAHYQRHHPRSFPKPKPTSKEYIAIRARLAEGHSVEDLCQAIDGYHVSPWHNGENPGGAKYLHLGLMVRDADHVNRGIEFAEKAGGTVASEREKRSARGIASWFEHTTSNGRTP